MRNSYRKISLVYCILMTFLLYFFESWSYRTSSVLILTSLFLIYSLIDLFKMIKSKKGNPTDITVVILLVSLILKALNVH